MKNKPNSYFRKLPGFIRAAFFFPVFVKICLQLTSMVKLKFYATEMGKKAIELYTEDFRSGEKKFLMTAKPTRFDGINLFP